MRRKRGARRAEERLKSAGRGSVADRAKKLLSILGSEYCSDPVFMAMCDACRPRGQTEQTPGGPGGGLSSYTRTTSIPLSSHISLLGSLELSPPVTLDILVEDPDERPYIWDLPESVLD